MKKILVTGATGFVGTNLCKYLEENGYDVKKTTRQSSVNENYYYKIGDIDADTDWQEALTGVDTVIHLVARVHHMGKESPEELDKYSTINTQATEKLVSSAISANVRRFIYLSTIKVNGENTTYTVSNGSYISGTLIISRNGVDQSPGEDNDWVETAPDED